MAVVTLDLLVHVLANSIFHPFVASLLPLCSLALGHALLSPTTINTTLCAAVISLAPLLSWINRRIAYGPPRRFDREHEVVVITGGGSGLGRVVAEMFALKGVAVAVLDVRLPPKEERQNNELLAKIHWHECNITDVEAVERAKARIEDQLGPPTTLLNNAAILLGAPFHTLSASQLSHSLSLNLTAHLTTTRLFLPALLSAPSGATIATVASVLGKPPFNPALLTDYAAAKAGLIAFHHSLAAELRLPSAPAGSENVRMLLVTPGQLGTALFQGVETPSRFLGPVVETVELGRAIVAAVEAGGSGELSLPVYARCVEWVLVLPVGVQRVVRGLAGVDRAMAGRWEGLRQAKGEEEA